MANAHRTATSAFSHGYERFIVVDYANGTRTEWSKTAWYDADRRAYYQEQRIEGNTEVLDARGRFDLWSNETTSVVREPPDEDGPFYRAGDGVFGRGFLGSRLVSLFAGVETVTTGTTTDGRPLVHLLGTGGANSQTSFSSVENARDVSLSAAVTPEGVVRSYTLRYEGEADGETVAVTETFRLRRVESVPDRPAWVTEGLAATDDRS
ncbi:hypothetical protein [Halogeometricum luteum]|uniref:Uncharacterized protein n=1 Tax=Halogeometricum luteum TaxID=2950537 RepID=A0ABU2G4C4_9EURY|nr:hypothetical protein [Halogeometricum sp. S3BR5-2]MDS0295144.1 hypothetical protein [Halogeometricum sp. S3BR5-2]